MTELASAGYDIVEEYDPETVLIALGGDGTLLHAAREFPDATILPVRTGHSRGNRMTVETDRLLDAVEQVETGSAGESYTRHTHRLLAAYRDGNQLRGDFTALNEIGLHHASPVYAAEFAVRIRDDGTRFEIENAVGDGLVVATPFGSTAYYRSITGGTIETGIAVGYNNLHRPRDAPEYTQLSTEAVVQVEMVESEHSSPIVLTRDNDEDSVQLSVGDPVDIRLSTETIDILDPAPAAGSLAWRP